MIKVIKKGLVLLLIFIVIGVLFFALSLIVKEGSKDLSVAKFNSEIKILKVNIINYEKVDIHIKKSIYDEKVVGVNITLYDDFDEKIGEYEKTIEELKERNFWSFLIVENSSRIRKISVSPIILSKSGEEYNCGVQDVYKVSFNGTVFSPIEPGAGYSEKQIMMCEISHDCRDNNPCTIGRCYNGICIYNTTSGCEFCESESQCDDKNDCTTDYCKDERCTHIIIKDCPICNETLECNDKDLCTQDECKNKKCFYTPIEDCKFCESDYNCEDNNSCTTNKCYNGECSYLFIPGCFSCSLNSECGNQSICVNKICVISANIS